MMTTSTDASALPLDHHRIVFSYEPLPPMAQLEAEFGKGRVSSLLNGRPWKLHSSCVKMDQVSGDRIVWVPGSSEQLWEKDTETIISWGKRQRTAFAPYGYRPIIHVEGYQFWKGVLRGHDPYSEEHLVALGSSVLGESDRYVAVLFRGRVERYFGGGWLGGDKWFPHCRFPFILNEQPLDT